MRQLPSLSQPISLGSHDHTQGILLRPLAKPVHFTIRKSAKVRNAWKPTKNVLNLHFNHKTDLTFSIKTFTIKVRSLCVVLMISPLVVRRTFYLIVNDRDLALKIRLLFSIAIQLSVVDYIVQLIVVNVNNFLQKFKIIF